MITDTERQGDPLAAAKLLPRGSMIILRDYDYADRMQLAADLAKECRRRGLKFLVAASPELAARVRADGVHWPEALAHRAMAWRIRRTTWFITVAAHSLPAIRRACQFGADAVLLSPVFPTRTHTGAALLGPGRFARLARDAGVPVYALGGISPDTARRLNASGAVGLASIDAFTTPSLRAKSRKRRRKSARN
jgi:thiamine-phosphate pyrophosphorylase